MTETRTYGRREVELGNLDKPFFPREGITKGDVLAYHEKLAEPLLRHLADRPLTLQRFPDGIEEEGFYQKRVPDHFPEWVRRVDVPLKDGGTQEQVVADSMATLAFLVQQGVVTLHPWTSRVPELEHPDLMIFDLDPGDREGFGGVRAAAGELRQLLKELGLTPFLMLTGSDGAHVRVPLRRGPGFEEVRAFARRITEYLVQGSPDRYTTAVRKEKREGRLFLDVARNAPGQTAVAPYSLRARPGAPVATPLEWDELGKVEGPRRWTLASVPRRMAHRPDPWKAMGRHAADLDAAVETLEQTSR